jgi:hypothetical protein
VTKQADAMVGGVPTHVSSVAFSDHIVVTISQDGRVAHWVRTPSGSPPSILSSWLGSDVQLLGCSCRRSCFFLLHGF